MVKLRNGRVGISPEIGSQMSYLDKPNPGVNYETLISKLYKLYHDLETELDERFEKLEGEAKLMNDRIKRLELNGNGEERW
jgi:hypothetical protein